MKKRHAWPQGHWNWPVDVTHKHGVRCGEMVWVGGQVDLTPEGVVRNPGDLAAQTANAVANFARVLDELDCDLEDLVTLLCFYVNDGGVDEAGFLASVGECLPPGAHPAVTAVPVPYLAYEGLQVEIEGYAMRREDGERTPRTFADTGAGSSLPDPFRQGVRSGTMIFVSGQSPVDAAGRVLHPGDIVAQTRQVMAQVGEVLAAFGADCDDVVKLNRWYAGDVGIAAFEPAALACAAHFREPGPAATGIPLPRHADDDVKRRLRRGGAPCQSSHPLLVLRRSRPSHHRRSPAGARLRRHDGGDRRVRDETRAGAVTPVVPAAGRVHGGWPWRIVPRRRHPSAGCAPIRFATSQYARFAANAEITRATNPTMPMNSGPPSVRNAMGTTRSRYAS